MCRHEGHSGLRSHTPDTIPDIQHPSDPLHTLFHNVFQTFQRDTGIGQLSCHMVPLSSHMTESSQSQTFHQRNLGHTCLLSFQLDTVVDTLRSHDHRSLQPDRSIYYHTQSQRSLIHTRLCRCRPDNQACRRRCHDDGDTLWYSAEHTDTPQNSPGQTST